MDIQIWIRGMNPDKRIPLDAEICEKDEIRKFKRSGLITSKCTHQNESKSFYTTS